MKIVIPGGSGHLGTPSPRSLRRAGHSVVVLSRNVGAPGRLWDGRTLGDWAEAIDGADVVINLAGRSVDCRYGAAAARGDPPLARRLDARDRRSHRPRRSIRRASGCRPARPRSTRIATTRRTTSAAGIIGGNEPDVPDEWHFSIDVARAWERALDDAPTPRTRKVKMRTAMVMSAARGGAFQALLRHVRLGFGRFGDGRQYMSWIHERDFVRAVRLADRPRSGRRRGEPRRAGAAAERGVHARAAPRRGARAWLIPAREWMVEDRRVARRAPSPSSCSRAAASCPKRLLEQGFVFDFPRLDRTRRAISARAGAAAVATSSGGRCRCMTVCLQPMTACARRDGPKAEETRNRILDAALRLFRERGFAETTMRDVATEAGVATGAAYYYFRSKEDLVMAFYLRTDQEARASCSRRPSPRRKI